MSVLLEHLMKVLGSIVAALGTVQTLVVTGAFSGLMSDAEIKWLAIGCSVAITLLGGGVVARGVSNTTAERVASAMETAIKTQPPQETK